MYEIKIIKDNKIIDIITTAAESSAIAISIAKNILSPCLRDKVRFKPKKLM